MGFDEPCFADSDEEIARAGLRRRDVDFDALRAHGWVKLPLPDAPFADGGFPTPERQVHASTRPALGVPDYVPNYESARESTPELARALSAGDDLAAGAQLPQLELRQREEPARHRGRAAGRDPPRRRGARAASPTARWCACSTTAAATCCRPRSASARGRASSTASASGGASSACDGTNVNELTHQRLTDIGRAPAFYDCLVEVADRPREALAARWRVGLAASRGCWSARRAVPDQRLQRRSATSRSRSAATSTCCARREPVAEWLADDAHAADAARAPGAERSACATSPCSELKLPDNAQLPRAMPTSSRAGGGVERGRRARAVAEAEDLVLPGGRLRRLPRLLRPRRGRRAGRASCARQGWR